MAAVRAPARMGGRFALGGERDGLAPGGRDHPDARHRLVLLEVAAGDLVGDPAAVGRDPGRARRRRAGTGRPPPAGAARRAFPRSWALRREPFPEPSASRPELRAQRFSMGSPWFGCSVPRPYRSSGRLSRRCRGRSAHLVADPLREGGIEDLHLRSHALRRSSRRQPGESDLQATPDRGFGQARARSGRGAAGAWRTLAKRLPASP